MCNDYEQHVAYKAYAEAMQAAALAPGGREGPDALPQADDIRIGDMAPVMRAAGDAAALSPLRFGWPGARGPVFNFRSEGRKFRPQTRCLIPASAFFEFTGAKYPKAKHRFALADGAVMGVAGLWRPGEGNQPDAFAMLTVAPGPDVAPYHGRQIAVLRPDAWREWLYGERPEEAVLRPLPAGALDVATVRPGSDGAGAEAG